MSSYTDYTLIFIKNRKTSYHGFFTTALSKILLHVPSFQIICLSIFNYNSLTDHLQRVAICVPRISIKK